MPTSTTCATANVIGRYSVKRVPRPLSLEIEMRPPNDASSARTTSMPTPRPASSVTSVAVVEARLENQFHQFAIAQNLIRRDQLALDGARLDTIQMQPATVIADARR